jgi:hypothetical protein
MVDRYDRIRDRKPVRAGLKRAALHWVRAAYEVAAGWGALIEEVVAASREDDEAGDDPDPAGPRRIEVE